MTCGVLCIPLCYSNVVRIIIYLDKLANDLWYLMHDGSVKTVVLVLHC